MLDYWYDLVMTFGVMEDTLCYCIWLYCIGSDCYMTNRYDVMPSEKRAYLIALYLSPGTSYLHLSTSACHSPRISLVGRTGRYAFLRRLLHTAGPTYLLLLRYGFCSLPPSSTLSAYLGPVTCLHLAYPLCLLSPVLATVSPPS